MNRRGMPRTIRVPIITRVLQRLGATPDETCWLWPGAKNGVGYGVVGRGGKHGGNAYVHRVTYEHFVGPIPKGMVLDHLCRVRRCCNPRHLEPVTHRINLLRGFGPSAINADKTHCPQQHEYDSANTYFYPDGGRRCRACAREDQRRRRETRRAA